MINEKIKKFLENQKDNIIKSNWEDLFNYYWKSPVLTCPSNSEMYYIMDMLIKVDPTIDQARDTFILKILKESFGSIIFANFRKPVNILNCINFLLHEKFFGYEIGDISDIIMNNEDELGVQVIFKDGEYMLDTL